MDIEPANLDDIPSLCCLLDQLFAQEAEFKPDRQTQERGLRLIIDNPEIGTILVARSNIQLVGMVNLLYTVSTALGEKVALLEDMVVSTEHRANGIGSQLLTHALSFAKHKGCKRITLLTDADNQKAQAFYQRHGFSRSPMVPLRRNLF